MTKYSGFLILNQGESYLSIFLLLTAEAFGALTPLWSDLIRTLDSQNSSPLILKAG
jgi:hypothetical protein